MVFPETVFFDFVLLRLEEEMAGYIPPAPKAMPCDRWLARSALQKAIRRGEVDIAQGALATLLEQDRYGVWRHLIVIALEDVGVAEMDTVARVVATGRNRPWRKARGGEWAVASLIVKQMAEGRHCQAACDLLLRATNCPNLELARAHALDAGPHALHRLLRDDHASLEHRGIAALALGGGLHDEQPHKDPGAVLGAIGEQEHSSRVVATCSAAWRTARNPMALLLLLVWQQWLANDRLVVRDDAIPPAQISVGVPSYAVDQFTRTGGQVARAYLARDQEMRSILDAAGISRAQQPRVVGDLLFLSEGGLLKARAVWPIGDILRLPVRALPGAIKLGPALPAAMGQAQSQAALISHIRSHLLHH